MAKIGTGIAETKPTKFFLFFRCHGLSSREFYADSLEEAKGAAEAVLRTFESAGHKIEWAYLVPDLGTVLRGAE